MVRKKVLIRKKDRKVIDAGRFESPKNPTDPAISEEFANASHRAGSGSGMIEQKLRQNTSSTPDMTGQDLDAQWERDDIGDEMAGGDNMTPDQSVVDEIGDAVGVTYEDEKPLSTSVEERSPGGSDISDAGSQRRKPRDREESSIIPENHEEPNDWE